MNIDFSGKNFVCVVLMKVTNLMKDILKVEYLMTIVVVYQTQIPEGKWHMEFYDVHFHCVKNYNSVMIKLHSTELYFRINLML